MFRFIKSLNPPFPPFFERGDLFFLAGILAVNRTMILLHPVCGSPFVKGERGIFLSQLYLG